MASIQPINIAYIVAAAGLLGLAGWSLVSYRKQPSRLTKYLGLTGLFASLYFLANALPFIVTSNLDVLRLAINIGDIFYYSTILTQVWLIWYLAFNQRIKLWLLLAPALVLSLAVYISYVYNIWHTHVSLQSGSLNYSWPALALRFDALLASLLIISGVCIIRLIGTASSFLGRMRILVLALAFLAGGINGVYNTLFLRGLNDSPVLWVIYVVVFGLLLVVSLTGRVHRQKAS